MMRVSFTQSSLGTLALSRTPHYRPNPAGKSHASSKARRIAIAEDQRGAIRQSDDVGRHECRVTLYLLEERRVMPVQMRKDLIVNRTEAVELCAVGEDLIDRRRQ